MFSPSGSLSREKNPENPSLPVTRHPEIPRREIVTLLAYLETGSHKGAAWKLGISESTSRQRVSQLMRRVGARNVAQVVWVLRIRLEGWSGREG